MIKWTSRICILVLKRRKEREREEKTNFYERKTGERRGVSLSSASSTGIKKKP